MFNQGFMFVLAYQPLVRQYTRFQYVLLRAGRYQVNNLNAVRLSSDMQKNVQEKVDLPVWINLVSHN